MARRARRVRIRVGIERVRSFGSHGRGRLGHRRRWTGGADGRRRRSAGTLAEPEFDVLTELLQLILQPTLRILELLDAAVGLPEFILEPVEAHDVRRRVVRVVPGGARNIGWRGHLGRLRRLAMEKIEPLRIRNRRSQKERKARRHQARGSGEFHWRRPRQVFVAGPIHTAMVGFKAPAGETAARSGRVLADQGPRASRPGRWRSTQLLPWAPLSTVTARRFCDQQEMSSQVATGRSLP